MDCLILAGNKESFREVSRQPSKALLEVGQRTILEIMLDQLGDVPEIDRLLIVGPKTLLEEHLATFPHDRFGKEILVFEQGSDVVENIMQTFEASDQGDNERRYILILPSDLPLLVTEEIREFVSKCDMTSYDFVSGITTEKALERYYPDGDKPGVKMVYFHFPGGSFRINNLHMVRPAAIHRLDYVRKTYALRYQKEWYNIFSMALHLSGAILKAPTAIIYYMCMQIVRICHARGWPRLGRFLAKPFKRVYAERYVSKILSTRFCMETTSFGGSAIDVDNDQDYQAICVRHKEWIQHQKSIISK